MNKKLLPSGFHDILFPKAEKLQSLCYALSQHFALFGFEQVTPPLLEFEESLSASTSLNCSNQMFRSLDPVSNKMLAFRSDFTAQIARICTTRLDLDSLPLRISYNGQVIRVRNETTHPMRQLSQAGIEIIGVREEPAEYHILYTALKALEKLGATDLCLDFSMPAIIRHVIEQYAKDQQQKSLLESAIEKKDAKAIQENNETLYNLVLPLFEPVISVETLKSHESFQSFAAILNCLEETIEKITSDFPELNISIDPLETLKFQYHTGVCFSIYSRKNNLEIGRGGRYTIDHSGGALESVGFTFYVDELLGAVDAKEKKKRVLVSAQTSYETSEKLRQEGYITLHQITSAEEGLTEQAKAQGCDHIFDKDKLTAI